MALSSSERVLILSVLTRLSNITHIHAFSALVLILSVLTRLSNSYISVLLQEMVLILSVLTRLSNSCYFFTHKATVLILSVLTRLSNLKLGSHRIITFLRQNAVNTIDLIYTDLCPKQYTFLLVLDLFLRPPN